MNKSMWLLILGNVLLFVFYIIVLLGIVVLCNWIVDLTGLTGWQNICGTLALIGTWTYCLWSLPVIDKTFGLEV